MAGKFFIGNSNNIATVPKNILVGDSNNIARKVKAVYAGNSSNQAVKVWPRIPEAYQEVEYIRNLYTFSSPGDNRSLSFIIKNVVISSFSRIVVDFAITTDGRTVGWNNDSSDFIFACYYPDEYLTIGLESNDYPKLWLRGQYFNSHGSKEITTPIEENERYIVELNRSNGECYINNELFFTASASQPDTNTRMAFFCADYHDPLGFSLQGTYNMSYNLYNCEIYNHNNLVMNVVPCYRKSDYAIGLYETVSKTFLYQSNYVAGPVI